MGQDFGISSQREASHSAHREPARLLVVIDTEGAPIARLFIASLEQVAEFDASTEEVASMTSGLTAGRGAEAPQWDRALEGHTRAERAAARIYTLAV